MGEPNRTRRAVWAGVAGAAVTGVWGLFFLLGAATSGDEQTQDQPLRVRTIEAVQRDGYSVARRYTGRVAARRASGVGFELGGMVAGVLIDDGEPIGAGDVLARLDTTRLRAARAEAVAARGEAAAALSLAQKRFERITTAGERRAASKIELDEAEDELEGARAGLERAAAALESIDVDIAKAELTSPFDALVERRLVDEGQVVGAGQPVARLLERTRPEVRLGLPPVAAQGLERGDELEVTVRDRRLTGRVERLLPVTEPTTRTVELVLSLDRPLDGLRAGDLASVSIERRIEADGFWLPIDALTESARGLWACRVAAPGPDGARVESRQLEVLHTDARRAFVTGTLRAGEAVIADGLHRVVIGDPVIPVGGDGGRP